MSRATSGSYNGLTPQVLLKAYACGIFPMADSADDPSLFWVEPEERGVLPLKDFHVPRSLVKFIRKDLFTVRVNTNWQGVIDGCATSKPGRESTWINSTIRELYGELFQQGSCHTVEVYKDDVLVGGLYGIQLGAAFFGESMFSHATNASKVALAHLVARLHVGEFKLLDTQFITDHLERLGAMEISRRNYHLLLEGSIHKSADFSAMDQSLSGKQILEIIARAKDEG